MSLRFCNFERLLNVDLWWMVKNQKTISLENYALGNNKIVVYDIEQ